VLTGLPNRRLFLHRLAHGIDRARSLGGSLAVALVTIPLYAALGPAAPAALQPLLALLLDKDPARRPSHDAVQALLTEAYPRSRPIPARAICGSTARRRAARFAAASRPAGGATSRLPSPRIPVGAAA